MINGEVKGLRELEANLQQLGIDITGFIDGAVADVALQVRATAIKSIDTQTTGTWVKRTRQGGEGTYDHVASRPGDAPNKDTGHLSKHIALEHKKGSRVAYVSTDVKYGTWLEFGTRNKDGNVKMEARPFLAPALASADLEGAAKRAVERLLKKPQNVGKLND
jgi:phage gpG-like protein